MFDFIPVLFPTVWLSWWVTYFPSGQHAGAIREYVLLASECQSPGLGWMLVFVKPLLVCETWILFQTGGNHCAVPLKGHLIVLPHQGPSNPPPPPQDWRRTLGPWTVRGVLVLQPRAELFLFLLGFPRRDAVTNNCWTFSHCNPVFPGKSLWEGVGLGGEVISCTNCTTLLRSWGTWVPAVPEQGPPLSPSPSWGLCRRPGWQTELLSGASHVSITWNVKQNIRGRLTCLCERRRVWKSPWKTRRCVTSENKLGFYPRELVSRAGLLVATLSSRKFDSVLHNKTKESEAFFLVAEKVYATQLCPGIQTSNLQITNPIP